jgi:threonine dehydrogenase-like Zn-dependent dehydrogenase
MLSVAEYHWYIDGGQQQIRTGFADNMPREVLQGDHMRPLLDRIEKGKIDPSLIISHRISLEDAPRMYGIWRDKKERVTKIVIDPWTEKAA